MDGTAGAGAPFGRSPSVSLGLTMGNTDRLTYRIQPAPGGWAWRTLDMQGRERDGGMAATRALAAACVIRSIARMVDEAALKAA